MNLKAILFISFIITFMLSRASVVHVGGLHPEAFNLEKDLLLVQFDCKTDVDDLHTVAAFATILADERFSNIHYHAVAGTYGTQEGLYVPPNDLFQLAFGDHWTDAHTNWEEAVQKVMSLVTNTLRKGGNVWIADAGQSDFSADLVNAIQEDYPRIESSKRIHVVQHAEWNEDVTTPEKLDFVKRNTNYMKIADGNGVGNGTPGFRSAEFKQWEEVVTDSNLTEVWQLAVDLANNYNGKEDRYSNEAILAGGLDFSDLSEVCWILGLKDIRDVEHFFDLFSN